MCGWLQASVKLTECYRQPVVINHPLGHVVPKLQEPELQALRAFLEAQCPQGSML